MKTDEQIRAAQAKIREVMIDTHGLSTEQYAVLDGMIVGLAWARGGTAITLDRLLAGERIFLEHNYDH